MNGCTETAECSWSSLALSRKAAQNCPIKKSSGRGTFNLLYPFDQITEQICEQAVLIFYTLVFFKRHDLLTQQSQLTPRDCWAVLEKAKKDFLCVIAKVFPVRAFEETLTMAECTLVLYYLEAVVILKHLQRPGVVEHMTVSIIVVSALCSCHFFILLNQCYILVLTSVIFLFAVGG